ncbi:hypothetical protein M0802_016049 [Mischocyttarus mexicanus]|nr:hypothetical protein M0802_016049 [Mischocyttarus mexicanus]
MLRQSQNKVIGRKVQHKIRYIQDKSTTVEVFLSKSIKRLRQGFFSEKLRETQNKVIGSEAKVLRSFKYGLVKVASWFSQQEVKVKSKQSDRQESRSSKKLLVWLSQG